MYIINSARNCISSRQSLVYHQADYYTHLRCDDIQPLRADEIQCAQHIDDIPSLSAWIKKSLFRKQGFFGADNGNRYGATVAPTRPRRQKQSTGLFSSASLPPVRFPFLLHKKTTMAGSFRHLPGRFLERTTGIEPAWPAWEAGVLPLNYVR